ncbi:MULTISPECIES: hypothetical protein [unclassified Geodermatophilus]|uniref:hypothetical protein n=1 Tax=unclassified Geodermatophilus TaxID=2637632 RepID=UPI003EED8723
MGRHSAADGATVHPVVAAALARRQEGVPAGRHGDLEAESTHSNVGWPGSPGSGEGTPSGGSVGWPGGASQPARQETSVADEAPEKPRGWRRLFGSRAA